MTCIGLQPNAPPSPCPHPMPLPHLWLDPSWMLHLRCLFACHRWYHSRHVQQTRAHRHIMSTATRRWTVSSRAQHQLLITSVQGGCITPGESECPGEHSGPSSLPPQPCVLLPADATPPPAHSCAPAHAHAAQPSTSPAPHFPPILMSIILKCRILVISSNTAFQREAGQRQD